ncbi:MAG: hypothetical protein M3120_06260, partial [Pseudomonadota bacterium]|nr:hypothetical protein [Pseudomonadota bacterium]
MKSKLLLAAVTAIAFAFGAGTATAGMQGQGAAPDAKKPEYKEKGAQAEVSPAQPKKMTRGNPESADIKGKAMK